MSEIVERLTRAILKGMADPSGYTYVQDRSSDMTDVQIDGLYNMLEIVREAFAELREPTVEMEVAGTEAWTAEAAMEDRSKRNWQAMVDEARR
jgi:hypothetical protein